MATSVNSLIVGGGGGRRTGRFGIESSNFTPRTVTSCLTIALREDFKTTTQGHPALDIKLNSPNCSVPGCILVQRSQKLRAEGG